MKLKRCYIENFGKISKQEFQFKDNLTIFKEENGWGKTTLSVFIKAMLYGFDRNTKEKAERQKYMPWNKGKYGGNLDLEIKGTEYRIERFFGETPKGDRFKLINLQTNKEIKTSTEKIGEEIFKLDKESFEKSIYIPQQSIEVEISNDLTTKLTNLDTIKDDMDKYDEAKKNLTKKSDQIKKQIKNIETEIKETEEKIKKCEDAEKSLKIHEEQYTKNRQEQESEKKEIEQLEEQLKKANRQQLKEEIIKQYNQIQIEEKECEKAYQEMKDFFKNGYPSKEDVNQIGSQINLINQAKEEVKKEQVTEEQREKLKYLSTIFKDKEPKEEELEQINQKIIALNRIESQIESQKQLKEAENTKYNQLTEQEIQEKEQLYNKYKEADKKIQEIEQNKKQEEEQINSLKKNKKHNIIPLVIIILGIITLLFAEQKLISIAIIILGIIVGIVQNKFLSTNKRIEEINRQINKYEEQIKIKKEEKDQTRNELFNYIYKYDEKYIEEEIYESLLKIKLNYQNYQKVCKENENKKLLVVKLNAEANNIKKQLTEFFEKYHEKDEFSNALINIRTNINTYKNLKQVIEKYDGNYSIIQKVQPEIEEFLNKYFEQITEEYEVYLEKIKINMIKAQEIEIKYNKAQTNTENFLKQYNIEEIMKEESIQEPIENIKEKLQKVKSKTEITMQNLAFTSKKMDEFTSIIDDKAEYETDLENYKEEKEQIERRKNIIDKTIEILEKTKEKLSSKYLHGMNENLNKYIQILAQNTGIAGKTSIDIDLNTNIEIEGEKKSIEAFSAGYKDLIGICTRLALIECIFQGEQPFLILDDPFVNLDEEKINNALSLIKNISKDYQIIYFSCHESRTKMQ